MAFHLLIGVSINDFRLWIIFPRTVTYSISWNTLPHPSSAWTCQYSLLNSAVSLISTRGQPDCSSLSNDVDKTFQKSAATIISFSLSFTHLGQQLVLQIYTPDLLLQTNLLCRCSFIFIHLFSFLREPRLLNSSGIGQEHVSHLRPDQG